MTSIANRNYRNDRLRPSSQVADRLDTIRRAADMIRDAGAGVDQRMITRDAGAFAPNDNRAYLEYVAARCVEFQERKRKLRVHGEWPAATFVWRPPHYGETAKRQIGDTDWQQFEPGAALQYELYVRSIAVKDVAPAQPTVRPAPRHPYGRALLPALPFSMMPSLL